MAGTEAAFRRVNEAIERGRWPGERGSAAFRCECANEGCTELVELTADEYERVRSNPRRFVVVPGHESPEIEDVVETHAGFLVIEKRGQAAQVAEATDPRT